MENPSEKQSEVKTEIKPGTPFESNEYSDRRNLKIQKITAVVLAIFLLSFTTSLALYIKIRKSAGTNQDNSNSISEQKDEDEGKYINKILSRSKKKDGRNEFYWTFPDGTGRELINFNIKMDNTSRFLEDILISPDRKHFIVITGDKKELEEVNKLLLTGDEKALSEAYSRNLKYDFFVEDIESGGSVKIQPEKVFEKIGSFKTVLFDGWANKDNVFFEAKNSSVFDSKAPDQRVVLGIYNLPTGAVTSLADMQAKNLKGQFLSEDGKILNYVKNYGLDGSVHVLKNLQTGEEQMIDSQSYLSNDGEYFVRYSDKNFKGNLDQMREINIVKIPDLQNNISTIKLDDPRRYFVNEYKNLVWSDDYSLFSVVAEYDRSGYGIEYKEPQLYVYERNGKMKCMWDLNDSVKTENSVYPEKYTDKLFSKDNRYLLLVSSPITEFGRTVYWRTFDLNNCKLANPKVKVEDNLRPISWL